VTAAITLAAPEHRDALLALMGRYHTEAGLPHDDAHREAVAAPLLDGSPLGAVWLIGPVRAPLGYALITFGWSVPLGGMVGWVAEVYVRPSVRKRGIGTEVLHAIAVTLGKSGLRALMASLPPEDEAARRFCSRAGLTGAEPRLLLTDVL
jgi:GNAT superfamily N-acetyltransferase